MEENRWRPNPELAKEWTEFFRKQVLPQCSVQNYWFLLQGSEERKRFIDAFWESTGNYFRGKKWPKKDIIRALENTISKFKIYPFEDRDARLAEDIDKQIMVQFLTDFSAELRSLGIYIPYTEEQKDRGEILTVEWEKHINETEEVETRIDLDNPEDIGSLNKQGYTVREIAEKTGKSKSTIGRILKKLS